MNLQAGFSVYKRRSSSHKETTHTQNDRVPTSPKGKAKQQHLPSIPTDEDSPLPLLKSTAASITPFLVAFI